MFDPFLEQNHVILFNTIVLDCCWTVVCVEAQGPMCYVYTCGFFLYLFFHDFWKINGRIKNFEKCTSGAVVGHDVRGVLAGRARLLLSWPTAAGDLAPCPTAASPWHRGPRRQRHTYIRGRPPAVGPSLTPPHSSKPSASNPSKHLWGMFLNLVQFSYYS
jgi:hypothetical protein